ncbi:MAG: CoA-transferase [Pseudomonadota bacterium]|mgnify:FL=1|nr:CoA synthetase [Rhodospirillaceae bacterium]MEE2721260.1 CoA-transferase [Pseudomonadota bacterium]|tara:strand:+ start:596 stop:1426 length:831 start_codon:yes stop_codon:yes gene_type:complete
MDAPEIYLSADEIASRIPDGALIGVPKEDGGAAMEVTRALIRRKAKGLRLFTVPVSSIQADMLIGAGCVDEIETSGVSMGEFGFACRFRAAVQEGTIKIKDATCPALYAELQASEKGVPFMPLRGILGSDIHANRDDWMTIDNPLADSGDPIVLLPAVKPDVALFHARYGDRYGNVWVGARRECVLLAHASASTLVTVEEIWDGNLMDDDRMLAGTIPPIYVDTVAHAPQGAWPLSLNGAYERDGVHLREYAGAAKTDDGFAAYLDQHVFGKQAAA